MQHRVSAVVRVHLDIGAYVHHHRLLDVMGLTSANPVLKNRRNQSACFQQVNIAVTCS